MWRRRGDILLPEGRALSQQPADVIAESQDHQCQKKDHPDGLGNDEELVARLSAGRDLIAEQHCMTSVQTGNRQQVHHSQHDGDDGYKVAEAEPVPFLRKYLHYCDDAPD